MKELLHQALDPVHASRERRERTLAFLEEARSRRARRHTWRYQVAAAALLLSLGGWGVYSVPVSAVSVELESPVQLRVNCLDRVVSAQAYSPQGEQLLQEAAVTHCAYQEAVERLAQLSGETGQVLVAVQAASPGKEQQMADTIAQSDGETEFVCTGVSQEEWQAAQDAGLSVGRYRAWQQLLAYDPSITAQEVAGWSMAQIRQKLQQLGGPAGWTPGSGQGAGQGTGQGAGQGSGQGSGQGAGQGSGQQNRKGKHWQ